MTGLKYWFRRVSALCQADRIHDEIAEEIRFHLEQRSAENVRCGMSPAEAMRQARMVFGNLNEIRETGYALRGGGWIEAFFQDLRYGLRALHNAPAFTATAVLTLALGIGANSAIFELINVIRLRPLPVAQPQELVDISFDHHGFYAGHTDGRYPILSTPLWEEFRRQQQAFSGVFAWGTDAFNLARSGEAHYAQGLWVSGDFFRVLEIQPLAGRLLTEDEDRRGCGTGHAVISYSFWRSHFNAAPSAVGSTLWLNRQPVEVVGVTPPGFYGVEPGRQFDVAVPLCADPVVKGENSNLNVTNAYWLAMMGRLKPGWTVEKAGAHVAAISPAVFAATVPPMYDAKMIVTYKAFRLRARSAANGVSALREDYDAPLQLLLAATALVLLIACVNVANLLLARASAREREMAVRLALGASRGRLIRQMMTESLLLVAAGTAVALLLARWLSQFLLAYLNTHDNPIVLDLGLGGTALAFTFMVAAATCVLFGLAPAIRGTRTAPATTMQSVGRSMTEDRERLGLRRMLVVTEIALSLSLLVGALLFVRTLNNLLTLDAGFRQHGVLVTELDLGALRLPPERLPPSRDELAQQILAIPGVTSAAEAFQLRWGDFHNNYVVPAGRQVERGFMTDKNWVGPRYFETLQIPMLAGRDFTAADNASSAKVVIVSEAFARRMDPGGNAIGRSFLEKTFADKSAVSYEIVGVVKDTKYEDLREEFRPLAYYPLAQNHNPGSVSEIVMRSSLPLGNLMSAIKARVAAASPQAGVEFRVLEADIRDSLLRERLMALLSGFFAGLAALLGAIGVYGVMSYWVVRRTNEIGIRMALGARRSQIVWMVMREVAVVLATGLAAGSTLSWFTSRLASAFLFGIRPHDFSVGVLALISMTAVAIAATYVPVRRATQIDPMIALRCE